MLPAAIVAAGCTAWDEAAVKQVPDEARLRMYDACAQEQLHDPDNVRRHCQPILAPLKRPRPIEPSPAQ
jgi:hypothetical protein